MDMRVGLSSHVWMWELDYKESWVPKNWYFWTVVLEKTLESPLDCKEIKPVNPKGNNFWIFIGRTDAEAENPILWPPNAKNWLIGKDPDAGKDWRQEEKRMIEDEMVVWYHRPDGQWVWAGSRSWWGQESLVCCSLWGHREWDTTAWVTELQQLSNWVLPSVFDPIMVAIILYSIFALIRIRYHLRCKLSPVFDLRKKFQVLSVAWEDTESYTWDTDESSSPITLPFVYSFFVTLTSFLYLHWISLFLPQNFCTECFLWLELCSTNMHIGLYFNTTF